MWKLFLSDGFKRQIASLLSLLLGIVSMFPGSSGAIAAIQWAASFFGVSGLIHATAAGTLSKSKAAGLSAALSGLIAIAHFVPAMAPLIGPMQYLNTILGAIALGQKMPAKPQ